MDDKKADALALASEELVRLFDLVNSCARQPLQEEVQTTHALANNAQTLLMGRLCPKQTGCAIQAMWVSGIRHLRLAWAGGVPETPKHHLFVHMFCKTPL